MGGDEEGREDAQYQTGKAQMGTTFTTRRHLTRAFTALQDDKKRGLKAGLDMAEKNFKALDSELTAQLPQFADWGEKLLSRSLTGLLAMEMRFAQEAHEFLSAPEIGIDLVGGTKDDCNTEHKRLMYELLTMGVIPRILAKEFEVSNPPQVATSRNNKQMLQRRAAIQESKTGASGPATAAATAAGSAKAAATPVKAARPKPALPRAVVNYDFEATNSSELEVRGGRDSRPWLLYEIVFCVSSDLHILPLRPTPRPRFCVNR